MKPQHTTPDILTFERFKTYCVIAKHNSSSWDGRNIGRCVLWTGAKSGAGYGLIGLYQTRKLTAAHRFAYEYINGPIPTGLQLDHLCRNRLCVNPAHLEPVTLKENIHRGRSANREKTRCPKGHRYTPKNTITTKRSDGGRGRRCRKCYNQAQQRQRKRLIAKLGHAEFRARARLKRQSLILKLGYAEVRSREKAREQKSRAKQSVAVSDPQTRL